MDKKEESPASALSHRLYENPYPDPDQLVVVLVVKVEENAGYVKLLEYGGIEGMIAPNQQTRSLRRSHQKVLKKDKVEVMRVLQVDRERGFIDLSKKSVNEAEDREARDNYAKMKLVNSMFVGVAEAAKIDIMKIYEAVAWPLMRKGLNLMDYFKHNSEDLYALARALSPEVEEKLRSEIERRLKPTPLKIRSLVEVSVDNFRGIELIKEALKEGEKHQVDGLSVHYLIKGSPVYEAVIETINQKLGKEIMVRANEIVAEVVAKNRGVFKLKEEPKVIGNRGGKEEEAKEADEEEEDNDSAMGSAEDD